LPGCRKPCPNPASFPAVYFPISPRFVCCARFSTDRRPSPCFVPNQIPVIHPFFCCSGSSRLLIHAYSWHNREQEWFLNNCSKSRVRGAASKDTVQILSSYDVSSGRSGLSGPTTEH